VSPSVRVLCIYVGYKEFMIYCQYMALFQKWYKTDIVTVEQ